ncbi:MAG: hypothetical protein WD490_06725 [Opitutales bacterium]
MKKYPIPLLMLLLAPRICFAPVFGGFPGFETLIARSDAIAVVWIVQQKTGVTFSRGGHHEFVVIFRHMIKGEKPSEESVTLLLRNLPFEHSSNTRFAPWQSQLLFLEESEKEGVLFRNINSAGSHWEVAPQPDFKAIEDLSAMQSIQYLLHESLKNKRKELAEFEEDIKSALAE